MVFLAAPKYFFLMCEARDGMGWGSVDSCTQVMSFRTVKSTSRTEQQRRISGVVAHFWTVRRCVVAKGKWSCTTYLDSQKHFRCCGIVQCLWSCSKLWDSQTRLTYRGMAQGKWSCSIYQIMYFLAVLCCDVGNVELSPLF